jgi:hypothetical protein
LNREVSLVGVTMLVLLHCTGGVELSGAQVAARSKQLGTVKSLKCSFPLVVTTDAWTLDALPKLQTNNAQKFEFQLDSIDIKTGDARVIGSVSAVNATVLMHGSNLHFIEIQPPSLLSTGNLHTLTVFPPANALGMFRAVYSRHYAGTDDLIVSQNYGSCQSWD